MKVHNLTYFISLLGLAIAGASYHRWFVLYHDTSNGLFGISFGLGLIVFAYGYNWVREVETRMDKLNHQFQAIVSMWTKNEKEDMERIAQGEEIK